MIDAQHQCCLLLMLICITMVLQGVSPFENNWNHLSEDIKIRLPAPFVVSTSLGVIPQKDISGPRSFGTGKIEKIVEDKSEPTLIRGHNVVYNYQNGEMQKYVNSQSVHDKSPKIKFYTMNCTMGHQCNAIIPAHTTTPSPLRRNPIRSDEDMRNYLKKYGLDNGFNYADDDRANRNSIVARYFKGEEEKIKNAREGKKISSSFYDNRDFWPGSQFRPKREYFDSSPKAKIYKYESKSARDFQNQNKKDYDWDSIQTVSGVDSNIQYTQELPSPSFSNPKKYPYPKEYPIVGITSKGLWNRFSNSKVSQYDRQKNNWIKVSESNNDLGSGSVTVSSKPIDRFPSNTHDSSSKAIGVTVLDPFSEAMTPHSGNSYDRPVRPSIGYHRPNSYDLPTRPSYSHNEVSNSHHRPSRPSSSHHEASNHYEPPKHSHNYNEQHSYYGAPKPSSSYYEPSNNGFPPKPSTSYDVPSSYDRPPKPSSSSHNEAGSYGRPYGENGRPFPPPSPSAKSVSFPLRVLPKKYNSPSVAFPNPYRPSSMTYNPPSATYGPPSLTYSPPSLTYGPPILTYGPPIFIDSNFTQVTENNITDTQEETVTTELPTTTTTHIPFIVTQPRTTTTERPRQENLQSGGGGGGGGLLDNRYAVMAAVGAGLIPASLAALLPVIVGKKRRRRRRSAAADWRSSPPYNPSPPAVHLQPDPLVTLLLSKSQHSSHSFR